MYRLFPARLCLAFCMVCCRLPVGDVLAMADEQLVTNPSQYRYPAIREASLPIYRFAPPKHEGNESRSAIVFFSSEGNSELQFDAETYARHFASRGMMAPMLTPTFTQFFSEEPGGWGNELMAPWVVPDRAIPAMGSKIRRVGRKLNSKGGQGFGGFMVGRTTRAHQRATRMTFSRVHGDLWFALRP